MKTKAKVWALFLACMMLITLLTSSVLATESTMVSINGEPLESGKTYQYGKGKVLFNSATNTLTLENATIEEDGDTPVPVLGITGDLTIEVKGNNTITSLEKRPIHIGLSTGGTANVIFEGSSEDKLTIETDGDALQADGGNITIDGFVLNITSKEYSGIIALNSSNGNDMVGGDVTIQNHANVTINTNSLAIMGETGISIKDSTVVATVKGLANVLYSEFGDIDINGSTVKAYATTSEITEGAYPAIYANEMRLSNNADLVVDSESGYGIYTLNKCKISDSTLKVEGYYHAIWGNENIEFSNSKVESTTTGNQGTFAIYLDPNNHNLYISGNSDVITRGGMCAKEIIATPATGQMLEIKVGTIAEGDAGAKHYKDSPYAEPVTFTFEDDLWKDGYVHIKPYVHVEEPTLPTCAGDKDTNCDGVVTCDEEKGEGWTWNNTLKVCEYTGGRDYIVVNTSAK